MDKEILKREQAITLIKDTFSKELVKQLNLVRISSPLIVMDGTGLNDDLNGIERPVKFPVKSLNEQKAVVVHSLAKWKRLRLKELDVEVGKGILTDMRALRPDEDYSPIHSIYVDQWDWEKHIEPEHRNLDFLKSVVEKIYTVLKHTEQVVHDHYKSIMTSLPEKITFIHTEELLQKYPDATPKERETLAAKEYGAIFLIGIGGKLSNGEAHDGRAADYDDWSTKNDENYNGLNGDIIVWNPVLESAFELSSMGVRVDKKALQYQLKEKNCEDRSSLMFHKMLLNGELPQSIGGGIGQSRLCMFMLKGRHIGEVQVSVWSKKEQETAALEGIHLL